MCSRHVDKRGSLSQRLPGRRFPRLLTALTRQHAAAPVLVECTHDGGQELEMGVCAGLRCEREDDGLRQLLVDRSEVKSLAVGTDGAAQIHDGIGSIRQRMWSSTSGISVAFVIEARYTPICSVFVDPALTILQSAPRRFGHKAINRTLAWLPVRQGDERTEGWSVACWVRDGDVRCRPFACLPGVDPSQNCASAPAICLCVRRCCRQ